MKEKGSDVIVKVEEEGRGGMIFFWVWIVEKNWEFEIVSLELILILYGICFFLFGDIF